MFQKKIFTNQQLSSFYQIALSINIISLFADLITYHFLPNYNDLELLFNILNELSLFMICLVIISQVIVLYIQRHKKFITYYTTAALTTGICTGIFFFWLLTINNDMQEEFIEFISSASITDNNIKVLTTYIMTFILLLFDFYETIQNPEHINEKTIPKIIKNTLRFVIAEYLFIFICLFGIAHFQTFYTFAQALLDYTHISIFNTLTILELLLPTVWIGAIIYYMYHNFYKKRSL